MDVLNKGLLLKSFGFSLGLSSLLIALLSYKLFDLGNIQGGLVGSVMVLSIILLAYKMNTQGNILYKKGLEERY